jgi:hypothetical protein
MPRIEFRGQIYNDELEMPYDIRQAYRQEKERRPERDRSDAKPLSEMVDMSPEVKAIYERALGDVQDQLPSGQRANNLPGTEEIYRQSAPDHMKDLPSDESIYRPSQPLIDPSKSVIEPESAFGASRFISSIIWALILAAAIFFIMRFLL